MGDSQKVNSINYLKDNEKVSNVAENDDTLDDFDDSFESTRTTSGETLPLLDSQGTNNVPPEEVIKRPKALMASCGLMATYAMRFNMAIAITAMIKSDPMQGSSADGTRNDSASGVCVYPEDALGNKSESSALLEEYGEGEFEWNENQQAMVLSSFFWGYILTQIPGGWVVSKVGGKWPFGLGLALSGLMTLLTPIAARTNVGMLLYCRIIEGLGQGFIFPALLEILAAWSPPNERSFLSSMAYSGDDL
ncbi:sialin-like [Folsomia candida]|uniref:sialin-like n=1 Tax=Folsomia candida TaxID=158441 RepID=UPI001605137A|nr:sialin-like [Folsomia candida]